MRLIVIRHGKTEGNKKGKLQGQRLDEPLSEEGLNEVRKIIPKLTDYAVGALYASPLRRAYETAEIVAKKLDLPIIIRNELLERDFGTLSGLTWDEIAKLGYTNLREADEGLIYDYQPFGGESAQQVRGRILQFLSKIKSMHLSQEAIVCITHGGIIRLLYDMLDFKQPKHTANALHIFELKD